MMADDLFTEKGNDGDLWISSREHGTAVAICREVNGGWFAAEDDSFFGQVGPFDSLDVLIDHIEENKLFGAWGSPGN
jgi:hypothetical protein